MIKTLWLRPIFSLYAETFPAASFFQMHSPPRISESIVSKSLGKLLYILVSNKQSKAEWVVQLYLVDENEDGTASSAKNLRTSCQRESSKNSCTNKEPRGFRNF